MIKPYYEEDNITIYHGDCNDILPTLANIDLLMTDPPYGTNFRNNKWDKSIPQVATQLPEKYPTCIIITAPTTMWDYPRPNWVLCWTRRGAASRTVFGTFNHWTPILVYGKTTPNPDLLPLPGCGYPGQKPIHPCPKPLKLMLWLLQTYESNIVLDPFMGSGTTLIAAKQLRRKAIGIEIEEKYCEAAVKRLAQGVLDL